MEIFKIKSSHPKTEYAAVWDISLGRTVWEDIDKINIIQHWLLNNKERIINQYPAFNDGGTGLGPNSVTSRSGTYNLFNFAEELPELNDLLNFFRKSYLKFIEKDFNSPRDLSIVCWFNVVDANQQIKEHLHGSEPDGYLSGNMHLGDYHTYTYYRSPFAPFGFIPFTNVTGGLTLFPSYVPHKTDVYGDHNRPRISIAFDLRLSEIWTKDHNGEQRLHSIPFMNADIFNQLKENA
jgi:hypothetical protein